MSQRKSDLIKNNQGNFFEDFEVGQTLIHGVPRTITESDATLYLALTGSRYALHCAKTIAERVGFKANPIDNFLVFHIAFGKTVNDISLNAVANLGYAEVVFHQPCYAGDTLSVSSQITGLKENSNGKAGIVYVHSTAINQAEEKVLDWKRWVMVKKNDFSSTNVQESIPKLASQIALENQNFSSEFNFAKWQDNDSDFQARFNDITVGGIISHGGGITINDSDHSLATRLYQNNARVHFDQTMMNETPNKKRLVYGGHIISLCRALSYNGLGNAIWLSAINGGTHCNPSYAGDTIYTQSRILEKSDIDGRNDLGLVRIQMLGVKNQSPEKIGNFYQESVSRKKYHPDVVLDLDYCVFILK